MSNSVNLFEFIGVANIL